MLGRNGNIAYVRYDHQGRIVPGGPIIQARPPRVGNWQAVSNVIGTNWTGSSGSSVLRAFVRIDYFNRVVPSSLLLLNKEPGDANSQTTWVEINAQYRGVQTTTTTTTTSSSTTSTTSTTTLPPSDSYPLASSCSALFATSYYVIDGTPLVTGTLVYTSPSLTTHVPNGTYVYRNLSNGQKISWTITAGDGILANPVYCPIDFNIDSECQLGSSIVIIGGVFGGQGTDYEISFPTDGSQLFLTEAAALASTFWVNWSYGDNLTIDQVNYPGPAGGTYWTAMRDLNNPTNVIAKSVVTVIC